MLAGAEVIALPVATYGFRRDAFRAELAVMAQQNHVFVVAVNKAGREQLPGESEPRDHFGLSCILNRCAEANELLDWARDRRPDLYSPLAG